MLEDSRQLQILEDESELSYQDCCSGGERLSVAGFGLNQLSGSSSIDDFINRIGGDIFLVTGSDLDFQVIVPDLDKDDFIIQLDADLDEPSRIYSIALALGHYSLHRPKDGSGSAAVPFVTSNEMELEAHAFAVGFLMQEQSFKTLWGNFDGDIVEISKRFNLPQEVVESRAFSLGLIE